jgi:cob(I)alamin adenosyltransferase
VKIYTRTGDHGETALREGVRVSKSDARVAAHGEVDELGAWLGLVRASGVEEPLDGMIHRIQRDLFVLGASLVVPKRGGADHMSKMAVTDGDVSRLEAWIDELSTELPPLGRFILSGGWSVGAHFQVARTVCRRAERRIVALGRDAVEPEVLAYINRLSDLLFVMARISNARAGVPDEEW